MRGGGRMTDLDLRTRAWLDDMFLYSGANAYGPDKLREELSHVSEWGERLRRNFEHVLERKTSTAKGYARRTEIAFESGEALFVYLQNLYDFLFAAGCYPEFLD